MTVHNPAGSPVEHEWRTLLAELGLGSDVEREFAALVSAAEIELIIEDLDRPLALVGTLGRSCACSCSQDAAFHESP
jgi:hypothetical protein